MGPVKLSVMPPVSPMLSKSVPSIPPDAFYEPKWDGFRSICFRDFDEVELGSRNERPLTRYFPELVAAVKAELPDRCVLDGEIIIATDHGLGLRGAATTHPSRRFTGAHARRADTGFLHCFRPARSRRQRLHAPSVQRAPSRAGRRVGDSGPSIHVTPATDDLITAQRWFEEFEGAGLDGLIAKPLTITYQPDKRVMFKIKHQRTADCVVAGYRVAQVRRRSHRLAAARALQGRRQPASVGVIGAFPMASGASCFTELQPLVTDFDDHPWNWAAHLAGERTPRRTKARAGTPARTSRSCRCDPSGWSRCATTTWKATVPPHRPIQPLAARPRAALLHLRTTRAAGHVQPRRHRARPHSKQTSLKSIATIS